jgi:hypothetical protein
MARLIVLALIIIAFSLLKVFEVFLLSWLGFDIIGHLKITYDKDGAKFFFEAAGVVAFIMAQPIIFFVLVVWGARKLAPRFAAAVNQLTHQLIGPP